MLSIGTSKGFRIYHTDPFSKIFSSDDGNIAIIEMLFSTSLVALILSPRHLIIQNTKVGTEELVETVCDRPELVLTMTRDLQLSANSPFPPLSSPSV